MAEQPNDASRKSKAEGDRWSSESDTARHGSDGYDRTDEESGGVTNRSADEEISNQEAVPPRGASRRGAHAGHGGAGSDMDMDMDSDTRRSER